MSTHHMWQPWHGSNEQGEYCRRGLEATESLKPLYKLSTFLTLLTLATLFVISVWTSCSYAKKLRLNVKKVNTQHA